MILIKRIGLVLLFAGLGWACNPPSSKETDEAAKDSIGGSLAADVVQESPAKDLVSIDLKSTISQIEQNRLKIGEVSPDFKAFKQFVKKLNPLDLMTISSSEAYIKEYLKVASQPYKDSTYYYFVPIFYTAANNYTDSLSIKFPATIGKMELGTRDGLPKDLELYLDLFGIELLMTEGEFYLDARSDFFLGIFEGKVSEGLNKYLQQRSIEMKEGFSEDANLLITFEQVYDRVKAWELLKEQYPDLVVNFLVESQYKTYLETLLTGLANSPVIDYETKVLVPEVKKVYESVAELSDTHRSTEIIKGYYRLLSENGFKHSPKLDEYLKQQGLNSMLEVQPDTR